jgi:hypothetical protein
MKIYQALESPELTDKCAGSRYLRSPDYRFISPMQLIKGYLHHSCGWHKPDWFFCPCPKCLVKKSEKPGNFGGKTG